ncbi:MAG: ABC transporter substrate-binding protein [Thermotogaceae bacterium]|nr:ABC transporter substrate-binding protein [Thermotogaceae bacterium]
MRKFLVFLLAALTLIAFAEVKNPDTLVKLNLAGEPDTFDPHFAYDTASGEVLNSVYECLIEYVKESVTEMAPRLATQVPSIENGLIKDDGKTIIFPIREGVKFHNGAVLTPEDVEYSFERGLLFDPAGGPMWMLWEAMFGVFTLEDFVEEVVGKPYTELFDADTGEPLPEYKEALVKVYTDYIDPAIEVDGNNVVFHLKRPFGPFLSIVCHYGYWSSILNKEWSIAQGCWDGKADTWWKYHDLPKEKSPLYATAMGTGPFKVVEWDRAQQKVILERFDDYWAGPAKLKKVIIWNVGEWSTMKSMLEKGDADIAAVPTLYLNQVEGMEGVTVTKGFPRLGTMSLHFNWNVREDSKYIGSGKLDGNGIPPDLFSDEHMRRAFAHLINYDAVITDVVKGLARRIPADLPSGLIGFNPNLPMYDFSIVKATEEFKKARNGEVWKKGFKLVLLYNTGNEVRRTVAEMMKTYAEMINPKFRIEVRGEQWPTYLTSYKHGYLPAFLIGWIADYPDPHNFIQTYYHSQGTYGYAQGEGFKEFVSTPTPELGGKSCNQLIEEAATEPDPAVRQKLYEQVQMFAIKHVLGVPVYEYLGLNVRRSWVKGWYYNPIRSGDYFYSLWKEE